MSDWVYECISLEGALKQFSLGKIYLCPLSKSHCVLLFNPVTENLLECVNWSFSTYWWGPCIAWEWDMKAAGLVGALWGMMLERRNRIWSWSKIKKQMARKYFVQLSETWGNLRWEIRNKWRDVTRTKFNLSKEKKKLPFWSS